MGEIDSFLAYLCSTESVVKWGTDLLAADLLLREAGVRLFTLNSLLV